MGSSKFAEATRSVPFSNGTEWDAWRCRWCDYCANDHDMHWPNSSGPGCRLIAEAMVAADMDEYRWPEAWIPEPPGRRGLPSYLICGAFEPCTSGGCEGDPAPVERAERVELVKREWAEVK